MSLEVERLQELLARVQRNAALPRGPRAMAAASAPAAASEPYFEPPSPPAQYDAEAIADHFFDSAPPPAPLDQSVDDMLLADPFPSVMPAPPAAQGYADMLDEDPMPLVTPAAQRLDAAEDISGVVAVSQLSEQAPEELLEDDIVEVSVSETVASESGHGPLDDLNFDDDDVSRERARLSEEPPASSSRHKVAASMDEALARAAEQIDQDEDREVPLQTPPPESGPQAAMALPAGIHAPPAPDIDELLEADILPVGGVNAAQPTAEQLGQTIDLEEARGPHLELDSALASPPPPPPQHEHDFEELEVTLPQREFGGGYQADLMPPPEARQDLDAHLQRQGEEVPAPESLAQYPSQQPEASAQAFAPVIVPANVSSDPYAQNAPMVTVDASPNAEFAPELLARPDVNPGPVAKFIRADAPRPSSFLELLDASLDLGRN